MAKAVPSVPVYPDFFGELGVCPTKNKHETLTNCFWIFDAFYGL